MTIYPYEVTIALMMFTSVLTVLSVFMDRVVGNVAGLAGFALTAVVGVMCCALSSLFGYWVLAGVAGLGALANTLVTFAVANTVARAVEAGHGVPDHGVVPAPVAQEF